MTLRAIDFLYSNWPTHVAQCAPKKLTAANFTPLAPKTHLTPPYFAIDFNRNSLSSVYNALVETTDEQDLAANLPSRAFALSTLPKNHWQRKIFAHVNAGVSELFKRMQISPPRTITESDIFLLPSSAFARFLGDADQGMSEYLPPAALLKSNGSRAHFAISLAHEILHLSSYVMLTVDGAKDDLSIDVMRYGMRMLIKNNDTQTLDEAATEWMALQIIEWLTSGYKKSKQLAGLGIVYSEVVEQVTDVHRPAISVLSAVMQSMNKQMDARDIWRHLGAAYFAGYDYFQQETARLFPDDPFTHQELATTPLDQLFPSIFDSSKIANH